MASVSWIYPQDQLIVLRTPETGRARNTPLASGVDLTALNFGYRINGHRPAWRPVRVFDDDRQLLLEFAEVVERTYIPPLLVLGDTATTELVTQPFLGHHHN